MKLTQYKSQVSYVINPWQFASFPGYNVSTLKPISHHRLRPDKTVLSGRVSVGGVNTIRDYSKLSRLKISKLNMFDIFSFVGSASAVWTEFATSQNWPPLVIAYLSHISLT